MIDAEVNYDEMDAGVACYCYGDSTCGQRVFYQFGKLCFDTISLGKLSDMLA